MKGAHHDLQTDPIDTEESQNRQNSIHVETLVETVGYRKPVGLRKERPMFSLREWFLVRRLKNKVIKSADLSVPTHATTKGRNIEKELGIPVCDYKSINMRELTPEEMEEWEARK